jgi:hypothetical protein
MSVRRLVAPLLILALCMAMIVGCGSSATTSHADVALVAAAEHKLRVATGQANELAQERCRGKRGAAGTRCLAGIVGPRQRRASSRFIIAVESLLAAGVGSACEAALKEALYVVADVPFYPGEAAAKCRAEIH